MLEKNTNGANKFPYSCKGNIIQRQINNDSMLIRDITYTYTCMQKLKTVDIT